MDCPHRQEELHMPDVAFAASGAATHEVINQVPPMTGHDAYAADVPLREAVAREGAAWAEADLHLLGRAAVSTHVQAWAHEANTNLPVLRTHDRWGNRVDVVEFHPSYHALMGLAFGSGVHAYAWNNPRPGAHAARAALSYLWNQAENGVGCPTGMAYSAIPVLTRVPELGAAWNNAINSTRYDPRPLPIAEKTGATIGMTLTEKQGGSDLRANTSRAAPLSVRRGPGAEYELNGHKWFCSAPMSDAFYVTAYAEGGLTCFLVPRSLPGGRRNVFLIQRLKDKCGNRSNASSEVEFRGTFAWALSEEGAGVRTAIEMAHLTRLDFAAGSAGLMRHAFCFALHHARHRRTFQRALADQPAMAAVLADLALESEANTALALRAAGATDAASRGEPAATTLERIITPVAKYWICKRAPAFVHEALECHGGNGFVEEHPIARLYREAPLNGIWEGSGNLIALDVIRALRKEPDTLEAVLAEVAFARGGDARLDSAARLLESEARAAARGDDARARRVAELMAVAIGASLLVRFAPAAIANGFIASRLGEGQSRSGVYGVLPEGIDTRAVLTRAWVEG
jgi:putative acyl-CoA dehydrogenase